MKLSIKSFSIASGVTVGLIVFLITLWFILMGYNGNMLGKLGSIYLGYSVSWLGALVGLIYGFLDGFVFGALFSWIYNTLAK